MGVTLSHSGSTEITVGVSVLAITGLGLAFTPTSVTVNVRKPGASSLNIVATVYGTPTAAGFSVEFSSPADTAGYYLDYIVWTGETAIDTSTSLLLAYSDLCDEVSQFLGYDPDSLTTAQTAEVDKYVQAGVRNFYYPSAANGIEAGYEWSFMRPTTTLTTTASTGTVALPTDFGRMAGDLNFAVSVFSAPVIQVSEAKIQALLQRSTDDGVPQFFAIRYKEAYGIHGQTQELILWPIPGDAYVLTYRYEAYAGKLSDANTCPLGSVRYSELITESCLAVAEQRANDEAGLHSARFLSLLAAGIGMDRRAGARFYGQMGSQERPTFPGRATSTVLYNDVEI